MLSSRQNGPKLTNKQEGTYGYIALNSAQAGYLPLIYQAGGSVISVDRKTSELNSPGTQDALKFMKDLMDQGVSPTAQQQLETSPIQLFGSGQAAMIPGGSFDLETYYDMLGDKLGVAVLPSNKKEGFYIHGSSLTINSQSNHQEEAWEVLKVLAGKEGETILARNAINFPTYRPAIEEWGKAIPSLDLSAFQRALDSAVAYPVSINTEEWWKTMEEEVTTALLGNKTVKEALDSATVKMNEVLDKED